MGKKKNPAYGGPPNLLKCVDSSAKSALKKYYIGYFYLVSTNFNS